MNRRRALEILGEQQSICHSMTAQCRKEGREMNAPDLTAGLEERARWWEANAENLQYVSKFVEKLVRPGATDD